MADSNIEKLTAEKMRSVREQLAQSVFLDFQLGDKWSVVLDMYCSLNTIEIVKLTPFDVDFMVVGDGVIDPERPRQMPLQAFVAWINLMARKGQATRLPRS